MRARGFTVGWGHLAPLSPASRSRLLALATYLALMSCPVCSHIGVVVLSAFGSPFLQILSAAHLTIAPVGSGDPGIELVKGLVLLAPLAAPLLNASGDSVILSEPLMIVVMPGCGDKLQVGGVVVESVSVSVVDFITIWDWPVCPLPYPAMGNPPSLLAVLFPAHVFSAFVNSAPHD